MIIAHVYPTVREANDAFKRDLQCNASNVDKVWINNYTTIDGYEHWYISERQYPRWARGRTYILEGKTWRSCYEVE